METIRVSPLPLSSSGRQVFLQESVAQRVQMDSTDAVPPVWILHEAELFVEIDEPVEQSMRPLEVDVVVAGAVDDQQLALQAFGEVDRRSIAIALRIVLRQTDVSFLVDRVVEQLIGHASAGHTNLVQV